MNTTSLWQSITRPVKTYPRLTTHIEVDVAIVGGGITGITAALELMTAGKKVAILEAHTIGSGTTGSSTGNLYVAVQPYYQRILSTFDEEVVKAVAHSRKSAIDYIEKIILEKNIQCHFHRRPWYGYTNTESEIEFLKKEVELLKKVGIDIEHTASLPLPLKFKKAVRMENQARFNPLQYLVSLAESLSNSGCQIFEHSRVLSMEEENEFCLFKTEEGTITAKTGIIATHTPVGINSIQMLTAPYRSYVVGVQLKENTYPEAHVWNIEHPHYSTCTHSIHTENPEVLVIAGSHHKTGQSHNALAHYQELESYLRKQYSVKDVLYRWSAQHYHSADGVPYIGLKSHAKKIYQATGFFADGLIYGTIAGVLLKNLILKNSDPLKSIYNSNRHNITGSVSFFAKENLNVFLNYMKDLPLLSSFKPKGVKVGEGRVIEINSEKCGVYRDENNKLHIVSAVCTHMKCIVNWNNAEKTWDCPCHGSRFSYEGEVLEGPAMIRLEKRSEGV